MHPRLYEGMFLIDAAKASSDLPARIREIAGLLHRHGAESERIEKWAESKLAYPIKTIERGVYLLVYFRADPQAIEKLRGDIELSEDILRVLILRAEAMSEPRGPLFTVEGEPAPVPEPSPEEQVQQESLEVAAAPQAEASGDGESEPVQG